MTVTKAQLYHAKRALVALFAQVPEEVARDVGNALHPLVMLAERVAAHRQEQLLALLEVEGAEAAQAALRAAVALAADGLEAHTTARWWQDADLQEALERHGLLEPVPVTDELRMACAAVCECEVGGTCLRLSVLGMALRAAAAKLQAEVARGN